MQTLKSVLENGDTANWTLEVCNNSPVNICYNNQVAFTIPDGVRLTGPLELNSPIMDVPVGFLNRQSLIWFIGDLAPATCYTVNFEFTVDDINEASEEDNRFIITAELTNSCIDDNASDNTSTLVIEVVDPCTQISLGIGIADTTVNANSDLSIG